MYMNTHGWVKRRHGGFTVVELLIAIVVIAVLTTIIVVAFTGIQAQARLSKLQSNIANVKKLIEVYNVENGHYPITTSGDLNPNWNTETARTDANCNFGTQDADWIPGIATTSLPESSGETGVNGGDGCYMYASNGTEYIVSAWNMLITPQTATFYRRIGFREPSSNYQFRLCNHENVGGHESESYALSSDYYKHSLTATNIINCDETPPTGA